MSPGTNSAFVIFNSFSKSTPVSLYVLYPLPESSTVYVSFARTALETVKVTGMTPVRSSLLKTDETDLFVLSFVIVRVIG